MTDTTLRFRLKLVVLSVYRRYILMTHFCPKNMIDKCQKLVSNMHDKKNYVAVMKALKLAFDFKLTLEEVHRVIKFNQDVWLKPYIDMTTELNQKKTFLCQWIILCLERLWRVQGITETLNLGQLIKEETNWFQNITMIQQNTSQKKVLAVKMKKARGKMNKPVCLGLSIVDISKIVMYDYWQDIVKPKYGKITWIWTAS